VAQISRQHPVERPGVTRTSRFAVAARFCPSLSLAILGLFAPLHLAHSTARDSLNNITLLQNGFLTPPSTASLDADRKIIIIEEPSADMRAYLLNHKSESPPAKQKETLNCPLDPELMRALQTFSEEIWKGDVQIGRPNCVPNLDTAWTFTIKKGHESRRFFTPVNCASSDTEKISKILFECARKHDEETRIDQALHQITVPGRVLNPAPVQWAPPEYPDAARERQIEGYVDFDFTIKADGTVSDIVILSEVPTGYAFSKAAQDALMQWKFAPRRIRGEDHPIAARTRISFKIPTR
jgi:TonB family protein